MNKEKNLLTKEAVAKLQEELQRLNHDMNTDVVEELSTARAQGDLSENADYSAARDRQALIKSRIMEIERILNNYTLMDVSGADVSSVHAGCTVKIYDQSRKQEYTYQILSAIEVDPLNGIISINSPLAKALDKHVVGDVVTVPVKKPYNVKILEIK